MDRKPGRGVGSDPILRTRLNVGPAFVFKFSTQEERKYFSGIDAFLVGLCEIRRSVEIYNTLNLARLFPVRTWTVEFRDSRCKTQEQRQVTASRKTGDPYMRGIDVESNGVST
jgi:hypothetical protein